jgi:hypothetical protein
MGQAERVVKPDLGAAGAGRSRCAGKQVWLALDALAVALMIPVELANRVAAILAARRCLPAVLTHHYAPEHRVRSRASPTRWRCPGHPLRTVLDQPPPTAPTSF